MTRARCQDRACASSVCSNIWLGLAFGLGWLGTGCEVVGEIGADDLAASISTSTGEIGSSEIGTTEDATKPMSTGTSSSSESSSGDDGNDTMALDLGVPDATTEGSSSEGDESSTSSYTEDLDASSSDGAGGAQPCCEAAMEPGCVDPELEACVCAADDFCCLEQWDAACVDVAKFGDCGAACGEMPVVPDPGECCTPNEEGPGCDDPLVQDCVCATDPYCCAYAWDDVCVDYVEQLQCGVCE